jgi:ankyrin repeat protein
MAKHGKDAAAAAVQPSLTEINLKENDTIWKLASFGEFDGVKALVEQGISPQDQDERGFTPLAWSARNNHVQCVKYFLELGCSMEVASFGGLRPLHHACNKNLEKVIRVLLQSGADPSAKDENGDSPKHYAAARGVLNIVVALLEKGAKAHNTNGNFTLFIKCLELVHELSCAAYCCRAKRHAVA